MSKRYARVYSDGSMGVCPDDRDLAQATKELSGSTDDEDTELVQVDIRVVKMFGKPKMQLVTDYSAICPCCATEVFIEVPSNDSNDGISNG